MESGAGSGNLISVIDIDFIISFAFQIHICSTIDGSKSGAKSSVLGLEVRQ